MDPLRDLTHLAFLRAKYRKLWYDSIIGSHEHRAYRIIWGTLNDAPTLAIAMVFLRPFVHDSRDRLYGQALSEIVMACREIGVLPSAVTP